MVYILLGNGFEEAEALIPTGLLRRAGVEVALVGIDHDQVTSSHGVTVLADLSLSDVSIDNLEMLILPGGAGGVEAISANPGALSLIQETYSSGRWLAAICAAPTLLARMGLMEQRRAVCYPGLESEMGNAILPKGMPVVIDGKIVTSRCPGSAFDFGLALVTLLRGQEAADAVNKRVYYGI